MRISPNLTILVLGIFSLLGCSPEGPVKSAQPAPQVTAPAATSEVALNVSLPISLNAVMVALVDHASEPLWLDAYAAPKTPERWRDAEYHAYLRVADERPSPLSQIAPFLIQPSAAAFRRMPSFSVG